MMRYKHQEPVSACRIRLDGLSALVNGFLNREHSQDLCDGNPCGLHGEVSPRTDTPAEAERYHGVCDIFRESSIWRKKTCGVKVVMIRISFLVVEDCPAGEGQSRKAEHVADGTYHAFPTITEPAGMSYPLYSSSINALCGNTVSA